MGGIYEENEDSCDEESDGFFLEVRSIGSYWVSLAPRLEDINRIDPEAFTMQPDIATVLKDNYTSGFSFLVCRFKSLEVEPHPIAYEHERLFDGHMFVPTRHAHGEKKKKLSHSQVAAKDSDRSPCVCKDLRRQGSGGYYPKGPKQPPQRLPWWKQAKVRQRTKRKQAELDVDHADWDHNIYSTCTVKTAYFSQGVKCVGGAGQTPQERTAEYIQFKKKNDILEDFRPGRGEPWQAVSSSGLMDLVDLLPCGEVLRHLRVDDQLAARMPNDDLIFGLDAHVCAGLPAPASLEQREQDAAEELTAWTRGHGSAPMMDAVAPKKAKHPLKQQLETGIYVAPASPVQSRDSDVSEEEALTGKDDIDEEVLGPLEALRIDDKN